MTNTQVATLPEFDKDLSGKRVLFIGDSFLFTGRAVLQNKEVTEEGRRYDTGYFYQLCKAKGFSDVEVVNWTYGGAGLQTIMDSYVPLFRDRDFDYVILSGSFCIGKCNRVGVTVQVNDDVHVGITKENFKEFLEEQVLRKLGKV